MKEKCQCKFIQGYDSMCGPCITKNSKKKLVQYSIKILTTTFPSIKVTCKMTIQLQKLAIVMGQKSYVPQQNGAISSLCSINMLTKFMVRKSILFAIMITRGGQRTAGLVPSGFYACGSCWHPPSEAVRLYCRDQVGIHTYSFSYRPSLKNRKNNPLQYSIHYSD